MHTQRAHAGLDGAAHQARAALGIRGHALHGGRQLGVFLHVVGAQLIRRGQHLLDRHAHQAGIPVGRTLGHRAQAHKLRHRAAHPVRHVHGLRGLVHVLDVPHRLIPTHAVGEGHHGRAHSPAQLGHAGVRLVGLHHHPGAIAHLQGLALLGHGVAFCVADRLGLGRLDQRPVDARARELAQQLADFGNAHVGGQNILFTEAAHGPRHRAQHKALALAHEILAADELGPQDIGLHQFGGRALAQFLDLARGITAELAEHDHVGHRVGLRGTEHGVGQPVGAHELRHIAGLDPHVFFFATDAGDAARRRDERGQATGLELFERAQDEVVFQRLLLVARVAQLVAAAISQRSERDVSDHRVVHLIGRGGRDFLERRHLDRVAGALVHQGIDAARCLVQLHGVHHGVAGRGAAEDAGTARRVQHLAALETQLAHQVPHALGNGLRGVILVGAALLAVGAHQGPTGARILRQRGALIFGQAFGIHRAAVDLVQQRHGGGVVLLALAVLAVRVEVVELRGQRARHGHRLGPALQFERGVLAALRVQVDAELAQHAQDGGRHPGHLHARHGCGRVDRVLFSHQPDELGIQAHARDDGDRGSVVLVHAAPSIGMHGFW